MVFTACATPALARADADESAKTKAELRKILIGKVMSSDIVADRLTIVDVTFQVCGLTVKTAEYVTPLAFSFSTMSDYKGDDKGFAFVFKNGSKTYVDISDEDDRLSALIDMEYLFEDCKFNP